MVGIEKLGIYIQYVRVHVLQSYMNQTTFPVLMDYHCFIILSSKALKCTQLLDYHDLYRQHSTLAFKILDRGKKNFHLSIKTVPISQHPKPNGPAYIRLFLATGAALEKKSTLLQLVI